VDAVAADPLGRERRPTAELVRIILESKPHPEMGYRACLGIMGLTKTYTGVRLEAASQRALLLHAHSYQSLPPSSR
jgi:hypothetical protein